MPRKNTRRSGLANTVYHVYNRHKSKLAMFRDDEDRRYFKALVARYVSPDSEYDDRGRPYVNYRDRVRVWSLTIKTTHFHLVCHQLQPGGVGAMMKTVLALCVRYFNKKYGEQGELFLGEVRMRPALTRREQLNAIAYVHENHGDDCYCEFCSHGVYMGHPSQAPAWLDAAVALELFGGVGGYSEWLGTRRTQRRILREPEPS